LVLPVRESDPRPFTQAVANIAHLAPERDILISKAVSWVLREAVKHHRAGVEAVLDRYGDVLPKATVKEVRTKLETGKKVNREKAQKA
jgi:3-methyladenine DNA glycosylase AlkD